MLTIPNKAHIICPNCESAISFVFAILDSDFAQLANNNNNYKYFGAVNPDDNLTCKYCNQKLTRGTIVTTMLTSSIGPITRQ